MSKHILLTGITGNLGAFAACRFLQGGHTVTALVRARAALTENAHHKKAVKSLSAFMDREEAQGYIAAGRLVLVRGEMTVPESLAAIPAGDVYDETWHFASSLKYMPKDNDEIMAANLGGLQNILDVHRRHCHAASRFIYISTAYVGGKRAGTLPEAPVPLSEDATFNNYYEQSKLMAENLMLDFTRRHGLFSLIFRPSIVMGDKANGRLINYTGMFLALDAMASLNEHIRKTSGDRELLRFEADADNRLNLVPLDDVIDNMCLLNEQVTEPYQVFNLTNNTSVTLQQLEEVLNGTFSHLELRVATRKDFEARPRNRNEKLMAYGFNYILPYAKNQLLFNTDKSSAVLGGAYHYAFYPDALRKIVTGYVQRKQAVLSPA